MPPNIIWIMTDQQRWDCMGCYGHRAVRTPHLDALAAESQLFTNAYTPSPICGPARAALFTGCFPPRSGVTLNWAPFRGERVLLPEYLKQAGYRTANVGKLHFVPPSKHWGFDDKLLHDTPYSLYGNDAAHSDYVKWLQSTLYKESPQAVVELFDADERQGLVPDGDRLRFIMGSNFIPESHHVTPWTARESARLLREHAARQDRPLFLFASFFGPHHPYAVPAPWSGRHKPDDIDLPSHFHDGPAHCPIFEHNDRRRQVMLREQLGSEANYRKAIAAYYDNIEMLDHWIGTLLQELKTTGMWEDSLIIFTSDHGDYCGQYGLFFKNGMYDASCKVPLMIKPPGPTGGDGTRVGRATSLLDLFGTVLDGAGVTSWREDGVECNSFWPALESNRWDGADGRAFSLFGKDPDTLRTMLKEGDCKLIRQDREGAAPLYELHDLKGLDTETENVIDHPEYRTTLQRMQPVLDAWTIDQQSAFPAEVIRMAD